MKNIMTFGTFDLLHFGHKRLLRRISKKTKGGKFYVGVSSDEWNKLKGKKAYQNQIKRINALEILTFVDVCFLEDHRIDAEKWDTWAKEFNIDEIWLGSDVKKRIPYEKFKHH